jgi:hypothetical protein
VAYAFVLPHAEAAYKGVVVAAQAHAWRKVIELLCVAATQHNVISLHCLL